MSDVTRYANGKLATSPDSEGYADSGMGKRSAMLAEARELAASTGLELTRELGRRDRLDMLLELVDKGLRGHKLLSRTVLNIYAKYTDVAALAESHEQQWLTQLQVGSFAELAVLVARGRQSEGVTEEQRADLCLRYLEKWTQAKGRGVLREVVQRLGGELPLLSNESFATLAVEPESVGIEVNGADVSGGAS